MKMRLVDLHKELAEAGRFNEQGLCSVLHGHYKEQLEELFEPTEEEQTRLRKQGKAWAYWGYDGSLHDDGELRCHTYTPLRQTIVLLICAMNNEL